MENKQWILVTGLAFAVGLTAGAIPLLNELRNTQHEQPSIREAPEQSLAAIARGQ
jgi:hypothetical protein